MKRCSCKWIEDFKFREKIVQKNVQERDVSSTENSHEQSTECDRTQKLLMMVIQNVGDGIISITINYHRRCYNDFTNTKAAVSNIM